MKHLTYRIALIFAIMGLSCANAFAQQVKGTVKDVYGEPVIGAAVMVDGTSIGTTVDLDGSFVFNQAVPSDAVLVVSSIGYKTARVPANGNLNIVLEEDTTMLEETVVVGYGVQKKSVVTAAISSITSDDLKKTAATRVDNLLQGMTSGVTVTSTSGAPDSGSQIRIRGIGTINDSNPMYIVDGMPVGGIDYLNPNDIERIEVLKDAASGAVYGARAANGVILVTTRQGSKGKTTVNYDFSYGWQNPWRKPQVLDATEYAIMMNEGYVNNGQAPIYADPYSFGKGTDWVSAIFNNNAPVEKHDVNISGGNDRVQYSTSAGFLSREGTIGGNFGRANYDRFTLRQALNAVLFDNSEDRDWLNKMTMQSSVSYAHINSTGISQTQSTVHHSVLQSECLHSSLSSLMQLQRKATGLFIRSVSTTSSVMQAVVLIQSLTVPSITSRTTLSQCLSSQVKSTGLTSSLPTETSSSRSGTASSSVHR